MTWPSGTNEPGIKGRSWMVEAMAEAWERGEPVAASDFLNGEIANDPEIAVRLIYEEVCLRREAGMRVDTTEVVNRYPQWGEEIRDLLACDRLLRPSGAVAKCPEIGDVLGPFVLLAELGRGAAGRTYLATDHSLADRPVVVKVIPGDQDEHLALAQLRHTHIVPLFSEHSFPEQGLRGLCMPFLGGTSLDRILEAMDAIPPSERSGKRLVELLDRETPFAASTIPAVEGPFRRSLESASYLEAVTWIASCLADALHYAHARGLVHMDLKPSNVLITVDGQPMLLDFHLARGPIAEGEIIQDRIGGTPGWMSPEHEAAMDAASRGAPVPHAVDGRNDVFALGLLLRETLAPLRASRGQAGDLGRLSDLSVGLSDIVKKCLARDASERYPDALTLAEDLRCQLHDLPLRGVRNRSLAERWAKWRRRHPGALAWGVTAAALVLAATVAFAAHRQRDAQVRVDLETGRSERLLGDFDKAIQSLGRGLSSLDKLPLAPSLKRDLETELRLAKRDRLAKDLHKLADQVRFDYGIDLPPPQEAKSLIRLCQTLWDRRDQLASPAGQRADSGTETDLLEIASVLADLLVREASPEENAKGCAVLAEARASFGPNIAIDLRSSPSDASPARAKTDWEHYYLGRFFLRESRFEEAAAEFRRTLEIRPHDFWSNFYDGLCAFRLARYSDAAAAFRTCAALSPASAICRYNRALAFEALGLRDEAHRDYTRALALDPKLVDALLNRGNLFYKERRDAEAAADFALALQCGPNRETQGRLRYNLALVQKRRGERAAGLRNAESAVGLGCNEAKLLRDELRAGP